MVFENEGQLSERALKQDLSGPEQEIGPTNKKPLVISLLCKVLCLHGGCKVGGCRGWEGWSKLS